MKSARQAVIGSFSNLSESQWSSQFLSDAVMTRQNTPFFNAQPVDRYGFNWLIAALEDMGLFSNASLRGFTEGKDTK